MPSRDAVSPPTMRAVIKDGPGSEAVRLGDWPVPIPGPGQVLVEVHAAGVCGTDLHILHDAYPTRPPVVLGHEVAGVVCELGPDAPAHWLGTRVACETHHQRCDCHHCRAGRRNLCEQKRSMGSFVDGGFADFVVVPVTALHAVAEHVSDQAAALCEPLACVCHLLLDPPLVNPGDQVIVVGPGPMGLLAAQVARASGGRVRVVGLPTDGFRLAAASGLGFDTATRVESETAEVVIECSGSAGGARAALLAARRSGRYVSVGIFGADVTVPLDLVLYKELTLTSGFAATADSWRRAMTLLSARLVDLEPLVSSVLPLSAWREVFSRVSAADQIKVVFDPRTEPAPSA